VGIGQLGMSEEEFWDTTPRAFFNALEGFEFLRRTDLEVARLQTLYSINVWAKNPVRDPKALWTYHWEKKMVTANQIKEQRERGLKLVKKWQR
jgi:hypothetical protein